MQAAFLYGIKQILVTCQGQNRFFAIESSIGFVLWHFSKGETYMEDKWGCLTAKARELFFPTVSPFDPLSLHPSFSAAPSQYFEQSATACKTQLDRGSLLHHEIPTNFGDCFYFVSLPKRDWRRQRRRRVCVLLWVLSWESFSLKLSFLNS